MFGFTRQYPNTGMFKSSEWVKLWGGTSINAMCYVRGQKRDFDTWQQSVNDEEWSYDSLWKTFVEQENNDTFHNKIMALAGIFQYNFPWY